MHVKKKISNEVFTQLREAIASLLVNSLTHTQESFLIHTAHALSSNIIRIKFAVSPGIRHFLGINEKDLGYDGIAELFERDSNNQLIHFKTYFSHFDFSSLSDKEILAHFNRLITSSVNQNLMHVYRDFDPGLGKIIRNIKLAITAHKAFQEIDRFDEVCIAPIHCELKEDLPTADTDFLFSLLQENVRGNEFIPELLSIFSRCIREQDQYSRIVPLITVALTFRSLFSSKQAPVTNSSTDDSYEISEIIEQSISRVQKNFTNGCNDKNSNEANVQCIYFKTIQNVLLTKTNHTNGTAESLFEGLKLHLTDIDTNEYRVYHRSKIEYYYRLCREEIAAELLQKRNISVKQ